MMFNPMKKIRKISCCKRVLSIEKIKILNKYPDWSANVIGDEPREEFNFNHKKLNLLGFKKHKDVLLNFEKTSIAIVCSRWNEPFGRTSLEASSRGCGVIISNRGGLPETTDHCVILKKLNSNIEIIKGDGLNTKLKDNTFDIVHSSATIEHVGSEYNQNQFIKECLRISKKTVIITTPNRFFPIDFHTNLQLIHWLPKKIHRKILKFIGLNFYSK